MLYQDLESQVTKLTSNWHTTCFQAEYIQYNNKSKENIRIRIAYIKDEVGIEHSHNTKKENIYASKCKNYDLVRYNKCNEEREREIARSESEQFVHSCIWIDRAFHG